MTTDPTSTDSAFEDAKGSQAAAETSDEVHENADRRAARVRDGFLERGRRDGPRRKFRTAFVLSGGGNLGAIQVGMLQALVEADIQPDVVLGCSIGALNGAGFALSPNMAGVDSLRSMWDAAADGEVMPSSRIPSVVQMLRRGESIHGSQKLRHAIETMLGSNHAFEDLELAFQCNAVDVESSMVKWFSRGELVDPILASAALPAVYPPVQIDGHTYIDGGVIDNVPIGRAVELGCRTIYVLHVGPHGRPSHELRRPIDGAMQAYWVARNSQFAKDLANLPEKVEAIVLPPGERPELRHDDFSQTTALIEKGYQNAVHFLDQRSESEEGWFSSEVLRPIERLVLNARSKKWRQAARDAANAPEGAILSARNEDGFDPLETADETKHADETVDPNESDGAGAGGA